MEVMTRNAAQIAISRLIGASFVGILTTTETKMNKTDNPFYDKVWSIRRQTVMVNYHYENAAKRNIGKRINAAREEAGESPLTGSDLEAAIMEDYSRGDTWYTTITDEQGRLTPFCEGKTPRTEGSVYLRARELFKGNTLYVAAEDIPGTPYKAGDQVPFAALEPFWPKQTPNKYEVEARTYKLNHVRAIRFNGRFIKVEPAERQETVPDAVLRVADTMINSLTEEAA